MKRHLFTLAAAASAAILAVTLSPAPAWATPGDGWYTFANQESGYYLAVSQGSTTPGAPVIQWWERLQPSGQPIPSQDWQRRDPDGDGYFHIVNAASWLALGVSGGATANGSKVIQWTLNPTNTDQQWRFERYNQTNTYRLRNRKSNRCLAIANPGSSQAGAQAIIWDCGSSGQWWDWWDGR